MVELTYLLKYTEARNPSRTKTDWSVRQIGIYHRYDPHAAQNTWILIFPSTETSTERNLVHEVSSTCNTEQVVYHPLSLHMSLIQARIHNWRLCISQFEDEVWELVRLLTTSDSMLAYRNRQTLHLLSTLRAKCPFKMRTKTFQTFTTSRHG